MSRAGSTKRRRAPAHWYREDGWATLLQPAAGLFAALAALRRALYRQGVLKVERVAVPVVVVGNIAVGGSGKTPVVQWLVNALGAAGFSPGIVSRGYGGSMDVPALVPRDGDPATYGDEPVLLADTTGRPVAIGRDRTAAGRLLLAAHPTCDVIVADDGLQHYRLHRKVEIVVVDELQLGNRRHLPAGPLREGLGRLAQADVVIAHGALSGVVRAAAGNVPIFDMRLEGATLVSLDRTRTLALSEFVGRRVHAVAGIGRPQRFFSQLADAGLEVVEHPFPDHHAFLPADLDFGDEAPKILTAKDAVKCAPFAPPDTWMLPVSACIDAAASRCIVEKLTHGSPLA